MVKKVLIASYDIEIRDSIKKCLEGYGLEFIEAASGISLTYKSVELKPDLIIMSFSPANLAAYHKIKEGKPEKTAVPIILLLPSVVSLPPGSKIKMSEIVKDNLLLELSRPSFRKELLSSVKTLTGELKPAPKNAAEKEDKTSLPSWDDIVQGASPRKDSKTTTTPPPEAKKAPSREPSTVQNNIKKPPETKKEPEKTSPPDTEKPQEGKIVPNDKEEGAVLKAKSLIDDLLEGKPGDEKKYNLEKSRELIDKMLITADTPIETVKHEEQPEKSASAKDEKDSAEEKKLSGKPAKPETKPAEAKPEAKSAEAKPEAKPAEAKTEAKPAEAKPMEIIRFEQDSGLETKTPGQIEKTEESKKEKTTKKKDSGLKTKIPGKEPSREKPEKEKPFQKKPPVEKDETKTPPKKILLADDEIDIRNGIKEALEMEGYSVTTADSGAQLVETGKTLEPDLIIADVIMPGLSGYRAVGKLKNTDRFINIPVIFMTAKVKDETMYETLKPKGPSYFMPKTFEMEELLEKVNSILKKKT